MDEMLEFDSHDGRTLVVKTERFRHRNRFLCTRVTIQNRGMRGILFNTIGVRVYHESISTPCPEDIPEGPVYS